MPHLLQGIAHTLTHLNYHLVRVIATLKESCVYLVISLEYCEKKLASLTTEDSLRERLSMDTKKVVSMKKNSLDIPIQCKLFTMFGDYQFVICTLFRLQQCLLRNLTVLVVLHQHTGGLVTCHSTDKENRTFHPPPHFLQLKD